MSWHDLLGWLTSIDCGRPIAHAAAGRKRGPRVHMLSAWGALPLLAGPPAAGPSRKRQYEEEEEELDVDVKKRLAALRGQG
jgi:hypothetical protein